MKASDLRARAKQLAIQIFAVCEAIPSGRGRGVMINQIIRSASSIGANIHESQYAQGTKDFISKFEIALKEASETGFWLELLYRTKYIDEQTFKTLSSKCTSLRVMLIASCKTAKENAK